MVGSVGGGGEEEEESQGWTPRPNADLKISTIYNRTSAEAPAEVSNILFNYFYWHYYGIFKVAQLGMSSCFIL